MNQEKAEAISLGFFHALRRDIKRKPSYTVGEMKEITHGKIAPLRVENGSATKRASMSKT
ncbi:MAG: hypothetical protein E6672_06805 [Negativicoccus succinicivorans]|nr:hypothetical protein [Negativicoccus succinicivorans]